jgi:predicted nucleotidyltransferase
MITKDNRYKILREFFNYPLKNFQAREISRATKIALPSTIKYLKALAKDSLIIKEKKGIYPSFRANRDKEAFCLYKKIDMVLWIKESGLLDCIYDSCVPDAIILFGSASKGEDIDGSDIDLFVQSKEKKLALAKYEKTAKRTINIFFAEDFSRLSKELKNNILNGTVLKGYIKVF